MKELIELAKEKGFKSSYLIEPTLGYILNLKETQKKDLYEMLDYFILCELQKWLIDKHNIIVEPLVNYQYNPNIDILGYFYGIVIQGKEWTNYSKRLIGQTREEALKQGLTEALKLI